MKIDTSIKPLTTAPVGQGKTPPAKQEEAKAPAGDSVKLSPLSSQIQAMESSIAQSPVVDTARVNQIKQAIAEGKFKINPEAIGNGLLKSVKDLIQSGNRG